MQCPGKPQRQRVAAPAGIALPAEQPIRPRTAGDQTLGTGASSNITVHAGGGNDVVQAGTAISPASVGPARVLVGGDAGQDTLIWDDSADATARMINFQGPIFNQVFIPFTGLSTTWAPAGEISLETVIVKAGTGIDQISVDGSSPGVTSTIDAGPGNDLVTQSAAALEGPVRIDGGAGTDSLKVDESANATAHIFSLAGTTITRSGGKPLSFGGFQSLAFALGTGDDTLTATASGFRRFD